MKRNLIICNTTYQLMVAVNIRMNAVPSDETDIILSDKTDFSKIAMRLEAVDLFSNVYYIEPKKLYESKTLIGRKLLCYRGLFFPGNSLARNYRLALKPYDTLYAANTTDNVVTEVFNVLKRNNQGLTYIEFEDGYGTYVRPLRYKEPCGLKKFVCRILNIRLLTENMVAYMLLYYPELYLYEDAIPKKKLAMLDFRSDLIKKQMRDVFGYDDRRYITKKFIILEESFKAEGEVNNAEELFTLVVDIVGEENTMLKTHPRNGGNSYYDRNIEIIDAPIAWEVLAASGNLDDKVLITCTSGSAINSKLMFGFSCKIIFLYKILKGMKSSVFQSDQAQIYLERFRKQFSSEVFVPETELELMDILKRML